MLSELKNGRKVVGMKQSRRAVLDGTAVQVYLAENADPNITEPLKELCLQHAVPVVPADSMKELGEACGISVGAAVAALLR